MLIGLATEGDKANFGVEDSLDSHFLVDFVATIKFINDKTSIAR